MSPSVSEACSNVCAPSNDVQDHKTSSNSSSSSPASSFEVDATLRLSVTGMAKGAAVVGMPLWLPCAATSTVPPGATVVVGASEDVASHIALLDMVAVAIAMACVRTSAAAVCVAGVSVLASSESDKTIAMTWMGVDVGVVEGRAARAILRLFLRAAATSTASDTATTTTSSVTSLSSTASTAAADACAVVLVLALEVTEVIEALEVATLPVGAGSTVCCVRAGCTTTEPMILLTSKGGFQATCVVSLVLY